MVEVVRIVRIDLQDAG